MIPNNHLKAFREKSKLSQKELALLIGKSESLVSLHEQHKRLLSRDDIKKYAKVFKIETYELFLDAAPKD